MRDRAPLLIVAALLFGALVVGALVKGSQRGDFADTLSTWRSRENGARALYLLAEQQGLRVERRTRPLERLAASESLVFLGVTPGRTSPAPAYEDQETASNAPDAGASDAGVADGGEADANAASEPEASAQDARGAAADDAPDTATATGEEAGEEAGEDVEEDGEEREGDDGEAAALLAVGAAADVLFTHLENGGRILMAVAPRQDTLFLDELGFSIVGVDDADGGTTGEQDAMPAARRLVPAQLTRMTRGIDNVVAPIAATLVLPPQAVPLLLDAESGLPVAAWYPTFIDDGGLLVVTAPQLFDNTHLSRGDNARFALTLLAWLGEGDRRIAFDEFHHGFRNERSLSDFARRYGVHFALLQLLLGLLVWVLSLRRFGPPQAPEEEVRTGRTDLLAASANLYRGGKHHRDSAQLLARWLTRECAALAGVRPQSPRESVRENLLARGLHEVAASLDHVWALADTTSSERDVLATARATSAALRGLKNRSPEAGHDAARKDAAA